MLVWIAESWTTSPEGIVGDFEESGEGERDDEGRWSADISVVACGKGA
jgi:hypothetical protein